MTATYTQTNNITQLGIGDDPDTWGQVEGQNWSIVDQGLDGMLPLTLSGNASLIYSTNSSDQAHYAGLILTGSGGTLILSPSIPSQHIILNRCSGNVVVTSGGTATAILHPQDTSIVVNDGQGAVGQLGTNGVATADAIRAAITTAKAYTDASTAALEAGQLPGQSGNAGEYLYTDGSQAGWRAIQASDVQGLTQALSNATAVIGPGANLRLDSNQVGDPSYIYQGSGNGLNLSVGGYQASNGATMAANSTVANLTLSPTGALTVASAVGQTVGQPVTAFSTSLNIGPAGAIIAVPTTLYSGATISANGSTLATFQAGGVNISAPLYTQQGGTLNGPITLTGPLSVTPAAGQTPSFSVTDSVHPLSQATVGDGALRVLQGNTTSGAAYIEFLNQSRTGAFLGLDQDGQFKVGGWSFGANAYPILHSQNFSSYALPITGGTMTAPISFAGTPAQLGGQSVQGGLYGDTQNIALRALNNSGSTIYFQNYGGSTTWATINGNGLNVSVPIVANNGITGTVTNANQLAGFSPTTGASASTIVARDGTGNINGSAWNGYQPVNRAGDTISGNLTSMGGLDGFTSSSTGYGLRACQPSGDSFPARLQFTNYERNSELGAIATTSGNMAFTTGGGQFSFNGRPSFNGQTPWDTANLPRPVTPWTGAGSDGNQHTYALGWNGSLPVISVDNGGAVITVQPSLGYTPLRNTSDTMNGTLNSGNLQINGNQVMYVNQGGTGSGCVSWGTGGVPGNLSVGAIYCQVGAV